MKDTTPMKVGDARSSLATNKQVRAMVEAMKSVDFLTVVEEKGQGTVMAYHTESKHEVFAAIQNGGPKEPWIVRAHKKLFMESPR